MSAPANAVLRWALTILMVAAGLNHFRSPALYVAMIPSGWPMPLALVYVSGVAEIAGGLGLMLAATRTWAAWGLIALFIAIFPANLNMALHGLPLGSHRVPSWLLWARLPLQLVLIAWAWLFTRAPSNRPEASLRSRNG